MIIRSYQQKDHEQVMANLKAEDMYYEDWYSPECLVDFTDKHPDNFLVAEVDGKIVGSIMIVPMGLHWAMIFGLVVAKSYREQGVATKLLERAKQYAKENQISDIAMMVDNNNQELLDFYGKRGFADTDKKPFRYLWYSPGGGGWD